MRGLIVASVLLSGCLHVRFENTLDLNKTQAFPCVYQAPNRTLTCMSEETYSWLARKR